MDRKPLVTIYTQSYNGEKYIAQCIESVLKQTYQNFEYFVCNHGSKDATLSIIEEYAKQDERIKVLDYPNEARGFYPELIAKEGHGKYFAMLDSDDYWAEDNLEKLVSFAEKNDLDMAVCGIYSFVDGREEINILRQPAMEFVYDICENTTYFPVIYNFLRTTWGKLIRMDVLRQADYSTYKENAKSFIADDTAFSLANYEKCKRIGAIRDLLLFYRFSDSSVTAKYNPKRIDNSVNIYIFTKKMLKSIGDESAESMKVADRVFLMSIREAFGLLFASDNSYSYKIAEVKRLVDTQLMHELMLRTEETVTTWQLILSHILIETQKCAESITPEDVEILQYINSSIN